MKQDMLLFSWSWRPGVAVDWLASMLVDVDFLNLAAVDVDAKGGGISEMADRRDWGGGGDDPEKSTQRMIERIWESLTDIRARMDQQAPVPPVAVPPGNGEAVPVAPVPPSVEVPFVAPVPPPPPVLIAEELVMQVEKFLRLQPPTYSGGPNPDTAEHWVHEIERVFATMRCPAADRVVPKSGWTIVEHVASPNCARKRHIVVQFPWELAEGSARQTVSTFTALLICLAVI
ncbi:hypothetical protein Taro_024142 [Colocasia esculenta]|uniref:Uncharacterized protein n=1 Tax=Colocasia esculenta TaxID=4460 RepID=A0A843UZI3_COLES|nr:hypothetical protein [Colocasia esculenta]